MLIAMRTIRADILFSNRRGGLVNAITGRGSDRPHILKRRPFSTMSSQLNRYSSRITQPPAQGASQAMLYATGLNEGDMQKAQVGIGSVWYEGNPCNQHLLDLSVKVKEGVAASGLVPMRFNTIGVSDGISMGTE